MVRIMLSNKVGLPQGSQHISTVTIAGVHSLGNQLSISHSGGGGGGGKRFLTLVNR